MAAANLALDGALVFARKSCFCMVLMAAGKRKPMRRGHSNLAQLQIAFGPETHLAIFTDNQMVVQGNTQNCRRFLDLVGYGNISL